MYRKLLKGVINIALLNSGKVEKHKLVILCITVFIFTIGLLCLNNLHDYLSYTKRLDCDTLVIEGWLFEYMLDHAAQEIKHSHYNQILILCMENKPPNDIQYGFKETEAVITTTRLTDQGINSKLIRTIPVSYVDSHRTFKRALTLKKWFEVHVLSTKTFNIYTGGPHARKTYTAFTRVFGDSYKIGVIPSPIEHYNSRFWWSSKRGLSVTIEFFFGYLYARFWNYKSL
jgi:hypothetical protein